MPGDADAVCIYCAKSFNLDVTYFNSTKTLLHRFLLLLGRKFERKIRNKERIFINGLMHTPHGSNYRDPVKDRAQATAIATCPECTQFLRSCCDLYHEVKCLELKLLWRLQTFAKIMKLGGRVAPRVSVLKEACDNLTPEGSLESTDTSNTFRTVRSFRKQLIKICSKPDCFPKVALTWPDNNQGTKPEPKDKCSSSRSPTNTADECNPIVIVDHLCTQTQVLSFVAIIFLYFSVDTSYVLSAAGISEPQEDVLLQDNPECCAEMDDSEMFSVHEAADNTSISVSDYSDPKPGGYAVMVESSLASIVTSENSEKEHTSCDIPPPLSSVAVSELTEGQQVQESPLVQTVINNSSLEEESDKITADCAAELSTNVRCLRTMYRCELCAKTFSNTANLESHKNVHITNNCIGSDDELEVDASFTSTNDADDDTHSDESDNGSVFLKHESTSEEEEVDATGSIKEETNFGEILTEDIAKVRTSQEQVDQPASQPSEFIDATGKFTPASIVESKKDEKESSRSDFPGALHNVTGSELTEIRKIDENPHSKTDEFVLAHLSPEKEPGNVNGNENCTEQVSVNVRLLRTKHQCEVCAKSFSTAAKLDSHKKVHNTDSVVMEEPEQEATTSSNASSEFHSEESVNGDAILKEECGSTSEESDIEGTGRRKKGKRLQPKEGRHKKNSIPLRGSQDQMYHMEFLKHELVQNVLQAKMLPNDENAPTLQTFLTNTVEKMFVHHCQEEDCSAGGFFTEKELMKHTKLHGEFNCNFCDAMETYAPDLALHEKKCERNDLAKFKKRNGYKLCARCPWDTGISGTFNEYIAHFVQNHLGLEMPLRMTCPLCHRRFFSSTPVPLTKDNLIKHMLLTHHMPGGSPTKMRTCRACPNRVKFAKLSWLHEHKKEVHLESHKTCNEPECKGFLFLSMERHLRENHEEKYLATYKFACDQPHCKCKRRFKTATALETHQRRSHPATTTTEKKSFVCEICDDGFDKKYQLVVHKFKHAEDYQPGTLYVFTCPHKCLVATGLGSYGILEAHLKEFHDFVLDDCNFDPSVIVQVKPDKLELVSEEFECKFPACWKQFGNQMELENHRKHHGNFECQICKKIFNEASNLALHEAGHAEAGLSKQKFSCQRCVDTFYKISNYLSHFLSSHLSLPFATIICSICQKSSVHIDNFQANTAKKQHFNACHNVGNMNPADVRKCEECPAFFKTFRQLQEHKQEVHGAVDTHTCVLCNRKFGHNTSLSNHLKTKHGNDPALFPFACGHPGCSIRFPSEDRLELHMTFVHSVKRAKYTCTTCQKTFTFPKTFELHVRSCGKEKTKKPQVRPAPSFVCETCGKSFRSGESLRRHNLHHLGPECWQFTCETCGKKCVTKDKVEEHMRTHTKEKPFQCQICGVKYAHRHNLRIHVNSKHGDITQDIPKPFDKSNLTSRKGIPTGKTGPREGDRNRAMKSKSNNPARNKRRKCEEEASSSDLTEEDGQE